MLCQHAIPLLLLLLLLAAMNCRLLPLAPISSVADFMTGDHPQGSTAACSWSPQPQISCCWP